jgi:hypothetical protein
MRLFLLSAACLFFLAACLYAPAPDTRIASIELSSR